MKINGLVIQKRTEGLYQGIEGDNWYLNYTSFKELDIFFEENIEKAWEDDDYVDVCTDMEYIQKYINISLQENINYRVLMCVTEKEFPHMMLDTEKDIMFLGYDYAYSGGSYYSAILNDIISKRIPQFSDIKLNSYGLFELYEDVVNFVRFRETMKCNECSQTEYLEEGDFTIYKLYEFIQ